MTEAIPQNEVAGTQESPAPSEPEQRLEITNIFINNFKKIKNTELRLSDITYIVGGNNSGKSSVLQAIHTAVSCAQTSVESGQKVIAESSLRYSPSAEFSELGHYAPYENHKNRSRGVVAFHGTTIGGDEASYKIEMYKARNHHNVGVDRTGDYFGFGQVIIDPEKLFSVYVPGLTGVPHREEMSGYASVFQKAAGGEANLVFRNIIRLLSERELLGELEELLSVVIGEELHFWVKYDPHTDLYVDVSLSTGNEMWLPVDLWGTGVLQITQIFAYVLLFKPALLLVDEPDSHIHPSKQKTLARVFEVIASQFNCKIILATHSRHLITAASEDAKVVWMQDGEVQSDEDRELATILMDLGALDQLDDKQQIILCTEDSNPWALELALNQLNLQDTVKLASFNGLNNSMTAEAFHEMSQLMSSRPRVIIHRDRDCLTEDELACWSKVYLDRGIEVFCPNLCDTEAYHVSVEHLAGSTSLSVEDAVAFRNDLLNENIDKLRKKFASKRRTANGKYWADGGAPLSDVLWGDSEFPPEEFIYGKDLLDIVVKKINRANGLSGEKNLKKVPSLRLVEELSSFIED